MLSSRPTASCSSCDWWSYRSPAMHVGGSRCLSSFFPFLSLLSRSRRQNKLFICSLFFLNFVSFVKNFRIIFSSIFLQNFLSTKFRKTFFKKFSRNSFFSSKIFPWNLFQKFLFQNVFKNFSWFVVSNFWCINFLQVCLKIFLQKLFSEKLF
jgi:hypothetical protein